MTILGGRSNQKGKSYLFPLPAKGRLWSALPGFSVAVPHLAIPRRRRGSGTVAANPAQWVGQ